MASDAVIYHNPRCSTSRTTILIERPFVVTSKGTRLARPVDTVREIL